MAKKEEKDKEIISASRTAKKIVKTVLLPFKTTLIIALIAVMIIFIAAAALKNIIRIGAVKDSSDPNSANYNPYGAAVYADTMEIQIDDLGQTVISSSITPQEMWDNDDRFSKYLNSVEELEYLLNAQFVTQYPYIDSVADGEFNGTIRFYRNNSENAMTYVSNSTMQSYVDTYNNGDTSILDTALNSFSLNSDGTLMIATIERASYTVQTNDSSAADDAVGQISGSSRSTADDGSYVVSASTDVLNITNVSYLSFVQKYVLPFNLLWSIVVMGHSNKIEAIELATSIADMAYEGEMSLIIDDNNVYTESEDRYTYNITDHYNGTITSRVTGLFIRITRDIDGNLERTTSQGLNISDNTDSITIDDYTVDNQFYTTYIETHDTNTPSIEIKKIVAWCAIYENDATYESIVSSDGDTPNSSTIDDTAEEYIADLSVDEAISVPIPALAEWRAEFELLFQDSTTTTTDESTGNTIEENYRYYITYLGNIEQTQNRTNINVESTYSYTTTDYANGTVTSPVFNEEIIDKFNNPDVSNVRGTICDADDDGWFIPALEVNEDTANLVDLMKYIINKANGEESEEEFSSIWNRLNSSSNSIYGGTSGLSGYRGIVFDYLLSKGVSPQGAAGIIGNFMQESTTNVVPYYVEGGNTGDASTSIQYTDSINNGTYSKEDFMYDSKGYGIAQWTHYTRKQALYEFAESYSDTMDIGNIYMQLDFFWQELTTDYVSTYNAIKDATDVETAARVFHDGYEQSNDGTELMMKRIAYAEQTYNEYLQYGSVGNAAIVNAAVAVHKYVRENGYRYEQLGISVPNYSGNTIDCSSFVTWVLVEAGVNGFTSGMWQWDSAKFRSNPNGWQEVSVDEAMPGDILCYNGHVEIVADASSNSSRFTVYNCGGNTSINAKGTETLPESTLSGHSKSSILKILRVTSN